MLVTFLRLSDLSDKPQVKITLPLLRIGDRLSLHFHLERLHNGRRETLEVNGEFKVTSLVIQIQSNQHPRQIVEITSVGKTPTWKAVKLSPQRKLSPARFPPVQIK